MQVPLLLAVQSSRPLDSARFQAVLAHLEAEEVARSDRIITTTKPVPLATPTPELARSGALLILVYLASPNLPQARSELLQVRSLLSLKAPTHFSSDAAVAPVTTGSSNPAYAAFSDKETGGTTSYYQSITAMPVYRGTSFEVWLRFIRVLLFLTFIQELRFQDYAQGRKTASTGGGAFGQSAFGGTSAFGQPAQTPAFGAPTNTGGGFGTFGQPQQNAPSAFGATTGTSAFGQPQPQQTTSAFGGGSAFGQNTQQQPQTSAFGNSTFGTTANKPATGFGAFSGGGGGTTGAFGSTGNAGGTPFGQTNTQPQPASLFGQTNTANNTGLNAFASTYNSLLQTTLSDWLHRHGQQTQCLWSTSSDHKHDRWIWFGVEHLWKRQSNSASTKSASSGNQSIWQFWSAKQ